MLSDGAPTVRSVSCPSWVVEADCFATVPGDLLASAGDGEAPQLYQSGSFPVSDTLLICRWYDCHLDRRGQATDYSGRPRPRGGQVRQGVLESEDVS